MDRSKACLRALSPGVATSQIELMRLHVRGRGSHERSLGARRQTDCQRLSHGAGDFVLKSEQVPKLAVVAIGPQNVSVAPVDQLRGDAQLAAGLADAALEHVLHVELARDVLDWSVLALERE